MAATRTLRRTTAGGISYALIEGFPKIVATPEGGSATEKYIMRTADVPAFLLESYPNPVQVGPLIIPGANRTMPGSSQLVTESVEIQPYSSTMPADPFSADSGAPDGTYDPYVSVTIQYETLSLDQSEKDPDDPITFLEHTVEAAGEFLGIPPTETSTKEDEGADAVPNKSPNMAITKGIPTMEHNMRWVGVINPPWGTIRQLLGTVNNATIPLFFDAPIDTVLFMGVAAKREFTLNGIKPWSMDFKFTEKHVEENGSVFGHQHVYRPDTGKFELVLRKNGELLYQRSSLANLFQGAAVA